MAKLFGLKTDLWEKMNGQAAVKCTELLACFETPA